MPRGASADPGVPADPSAADARVKRVALIGNPNVGKTTLFNALTGYRRHVANYPGVTVDIARGRVRGVQHPIELIDLPGAYSLAAASPDEAIVTDTLCGRMGPRSVPDCILAIVDASNPSRNLYLVGQLLEFGLPVVIALNMVDIAESRGLSIDVDLLSQRIGVPVVPVTATKPDSVRALAKALENAAATPRLGPELSRLPKAIQREAEALLCCDHCAVHPAEAVRTLLFPQGHAEDAYLKCGGCPRRLAEARERLKAEGVDGPTVEVQARYAWIAEMLDGAVRRPDKPIETWSDRLDAILTNRFTGALVLVLVLYGVFWAIFTGAQPMMGALEALFGLLGESVGAVLPEGVVRSLIVDGVIAGVGGVAVFLPQILILFAFIALLEDCGYLSRAAYMMDRLMRLVGLSGRSFIPLLSAFACAVPAIMGTRAISNRRERFLTIMLAPFMSCSARLPVYIVFIAAFVPQRTLLGGWIGLQPVVMLGMYLVGVVTAIPLAWLMKRVMFAGPGGGFMLELPTYKVPRLRTVLQRMYFAGRDFLYRAGVIILAVNVVVWALAYFPRSAETKAAVDQQAAQAQWDDDAYQNALDGAYLRESYLGRMGRAIEPAIEPLGWDWKIGVGVIASFPAREVIIATLGTLFNLGAEEDEESQSLIDAMRAAKNDVTGEPLFTLPVALSIMVFFSLCAQCGATLAVIKKETGSWAYPALSFVGMTTVAYFAAWGVAVGARAAGL